MQGQPIKAGAKVY